MYTTKTALIATLSLFATTSAASIRGNNKQAIINDDNNTPRQLLEYRETADYLFENIQSIVKMRVEQVGGECELDDYGRDDLLSLSCDSDQGLSAYVTQWMKDDVLDYGQVTICKEGVKCRKFNTYINKKDDYWILWEQFHYISGHGWKHEKVARNDVRKAIYAVVDAFDY